MRRAEFLPLARPHISEEEVEAASKVIRSGWWTTGPLVGEFEEKFADYIGEGERVYAAAVSSCTAALYLSLLAKGIGPGDEVIVPTWTFAATGHVVGWTGAKPVLCDIKADSLNIDPEKISSLITSRTKAIMPVHIAGYPCELDEILNLAGKHRLQVIEDAAHAVGTRYKGKKIGCFGDATAYSFYATKNLACGEGGMIVSRNREFVEKFRKLSYFGIDKEAFKRYEKKGTWFYNIEENGYKFNFDSIHAAMGMVQLKKLDSMNERRRELAALYKQSLPASLEYTEDSAEHYHTYHLFPVLLPLGVSRDEVVSRLKEMNIGTSVHFIPLHRHTYYRDHVIEDARFPVADAVFNRILSLPMFPSMTDDDVLYVSACFEKILKSC